MSTLRRFTLILALVPTALVGCGGGESSAGSAESAGSSATEQTAAPSAQTGSCNKVATLSVCTDLSGDAFVIGESLQRSMCEGTSGTFAMNTACPSENRLGSCQLEGGQVRRYYSGGNLMYDAAGAESDCTELYSGTWTAN